MSVLLQGLKLTPVEITEIREYPNQCCPCCPLPSYFVDEEIDE